jgi:hypothetical protein
MKIQSKNIWLMLSIVLFAISLQAQESVMVIYLKNGSIIKGSILEIISRDTVKVQTTDGNIFSYAMEEVEKIEKEQQNILQPATSSSKPDDQASTENIREKFIFYGGFALPVGDFTKGIQIGWKASTGFTIGMQYLPAKNVGWLVDASFTRCSASFGGIEPPHGVRPDLYTWNLYHLIGGLKLGKRLSKNVEFMVAPLLGVFISSSPSVQYSFVRPVSLPYHSEITYFVVDVESATRLNIASGLMTQLSLGSMMIGVRYISSKSSTDLKVSFNSLDRIVVSSWPRVQYISFIQAYVGITF